MIDKPANDPDKKFATDHVESFAMPDFTSDCLQSAAFLAKSLSDGNRLKILLSLREGRRSVSAIVEDVGLSQPLVSHHLKELKRSLVVKVEREGPFIFYEISDSRVLDVVVALGEVASSLLSERKGF